MASKDQSGEVVKPGGKKKGKTLPLTDFLKPASVGRWADEDVENETIDTLPTLPTAPGEGAAYQSVGGYSSAPSGPSRPLPDHPPFKVFIGNIPYDATEDEMAAVFAPPLEVVDVHIIKHKDTNKPRGCFVEFATRADLEKGLLKDGSVVLGRPIRIDVAEDRPDRAQRSGGGFGGRSERDFDGARDRRRGYGFGDGGYEDDRRGGGGFDDRRRGGGGGGFADTYGPDRGRPRDGGFGRHDDDDRRGPGGHDRGDRGYGGFSGRHEEETGGSRWGHISRERAQLPVHARSTPPPVQESAEPADPTDRPKLSLAPRAKVDEAAPEQPAPAPAKKANPFGDAKPIDAEAKIREIEEREKKRRMAEAQKRAAESEAARAAEVRAKATAPGRPVNGAGPNRDDDSVSSTSAASAERPHGMGRGGGRGEGGGRGGRGRGDGHRGGGRGAPLRTGGPPPGLEGHPARGWEGGGRTPRGGYGGRPRSGGSGRGDGEGGHHQGPGPARGQPPRTAAPPAAEPAKDMAGFQTVSAHQRARGRERDAEAAKSAAGPPGLVTKEEPKRAAMSNKFDLLNLEDE